MKQILDQDFNSMIEEMNTIKRPVDLALDEQRKESETRAILQDLEKLKTIPVERKRRWVWELIQNAKDCARIVGEEQPEVNINFILEENRFIFTHDGEPFTLKELLALVRRTSTKSYDAEDGNTGKFGTGFVTTHVLNRKVNVSGCLKNEAGLRRFGICIDRTHESLEALQSELDNTFSAINNFYEQPPQFYENSFLTIYEYDLEPETLQLAIDSIDELIRNLPFTLLINPFIKSITVDDKRKGKYLIFKLDSSTEVSPGIHFSRLQNGSDKGSAPIQGLFHFSFKKSTIALPVEQIEDKWNIQSIENQARLYCEFPLVGTEQWHIPFFFQSGDFIPAEPRDGVRTIKDNETKEDKTADENRLVFVEYGKAVKEFFNLINNNSIEDLYLISEIGLPYEKTEYTAKEWFSNSLQTPLRSFFLDLPLVKTASGNSVSINKAIFPAIFLDDEINNQFYSIAVKFYSTQLPDEISFKHWQRIISQETIIWGENLLCTPETLVKELSTPEGFLKLKQCLGENYIKWLDSLIIFLNKINRTDLGENYSIYPNQEGNLKRKQEVKIDPGLNERIKSIGSRLKQPVYEELLHKGISQREGLSLYNTKGFFDVLNTYIGSLSPSTNSLSEYTAVFELICIFNDSYAKERERWFQISHNLLPELTPEKIVLNDMGEFNYDPAELATIKYVCLIIEQQINFPSFCNNYFKHDNASAYDWLNNFLDVLFRNQKYEELIRKNAVIPMQNGVFRKLGNGIYKEEKGQPFDVLFKNLFKELFNDVPGKGDPLNFLIANEITTENLPCSTVDILTKPIDDIFMDSLVERKVEPDGALNQLFHKLNEWVGIHEVISEKLFPHFCRRRPMLYIKAFGPEVSAMIMALHKMKKPIEELQALANLNMSAAELGVLVKASKLAGGTDVLLAIAEEIAKDAEDAEWRKKVGDAAEKAFKEAIADVNSFDIENPDRGYDFEIMTADQQISFFLEIKSTVQYKENIQMSSLQGQTARDNPGKYALCVVTRQDANDEVTKEYFIKRAKFKLDIGHLVAEKVNGIDNGLKSIRSFKFGEEVSSALENEKYSVFVGKKTWEAGISFHEFVNHLLSYFNISH